MAELDSNVLLK